MAVAIQDWEERCKSPYAQAHAYTFQRLTPLILSGLTHIESIRELPPKCGALIITSCQNLRRISEKVLEQLHVLELSYCPSLDIPFLPEREWKRLVVRYMPQIGAEHREWIHERTYTFQDPAYTGEKTASEINTYAAEHRATKRWAHPADREALIAAAWKPSRVERILSLYGMDALDM
jgi:hypothetical protein